MRIRDAGTEAIIAVRGTPTAVLRDRSGAAVGSLHVLPAPDLENVSLQERARVPVWVLATLSTAAAGLALTFVVARRVLGPVGELTGAVRRMEQGDLDVRVATPRTGDEVGELGRAFNAMASRLATNERLRRQMVSDVAHELRSPVTNLRCTLEAMQDGLTAMDRAGVDVLLEETLFLQRLIADLQDLALAEAGHLSLQSAPVDVGDALRRAAASLGAGAGAPITLTIDPSHRAVLGDAVRLEQVFRNLLSNARQHTPADGRIEASVRVGTSGDVSDCRHGFWRRDRGGAPAVRVRTVLSRRCVAQPRHRWRWSRPRDRASGRPRAWRSDHGRERRAWSWQPLHRDAAAGAGLSVRLRGAPAVDAFRATARAAGAAVSRIHLQLL